MQSLVFCLAFFSSLIAVTVAQPRLASSNCTNLRGNYTSTSIYSKNLSNLLLSLSTSTKFDNNSYYRSDVIGQGPNRVYGTAYCRADLSVTDCHTCIQNAAKQLPGECPAKKEAIGYYLGELGRWCMLRYSDRPIFGINELTPNIFLSDVNFPVPDWEADKFKKKQAILFDALAKNASAGDSRYKFASGNENVSASLPLYGLMQCNPDLSTSDCSGCLQGGIRQLQICCNSSRGATFFGPSCAIQFENYQFLDMSPSAPSSTTDSSHSNGKQGKGKNTHKILIIIGVLFVMLVLFTTLVLILRFRKSRKLRNVKDNVHITCVDSLQFVLSTIHVATDNFSNDRRLGKGTSTILYKGILSTGQEIVVKRVGKDRRYNEHQFNNEVSLLAELQHRNVVKLLGFCTEKDTRLLIYEYLPNQSLDIFLDDHVKRAKLSWELRYKIILGIARGVLYLHEDSQLMVIHRDLKPSNILLDVEMNPKISNFSKASLIQADQTKGVSDTVQGTYGYMPPEVVERRHFSAKSDVFSVGILLLEIISGNLICNFSDGEEGESLPSFVWRKWSEGKAFEAVDDTLESVEEHMAQIMRCINIALLCVQEDPSNRPTMSNVVFMLNNNLGTLAQPSRPAFDLGSGMMNLHTNWSSSNQGSSYQASVNEASISELNPR